MGYFEWSKGEDWLRMAEHLTTIATVVYYQYVQKQKSGLCDFHFLWGQATVGDIDLGRGPNITLHHLTIKSEETESEIFN